MVLECRSHEWLSWQYYGNPGETGTLDKEAV